MMWAAVIFGMIVLIAGMLIFLAVEDAREKRQFKETRAEMQKFRDETNTSREAWIKKTKENGNERDR